MAKNQTKEVTAYIEAKQSGDALRIAEAGIALVDSCATKVKINGTALYAAWPHLFPHRKWVKLCGNCYSYAAQIKRELDIMRKGMEDQLEKLKAKEAAAEPVAPELAGEAQPPAPQQEPKAEPKPSPLTERGAQRILLPKVGKFSKGDEFTNHATGHVFKLFGFTTNKKRAILVGPDGGETEISKSDLGSIYIPKTAA